MTSELPSDHLARAQAIDPSGSFLVQAPAGSGKTELLTDRILALLGTVNRPEEIVAITFTRKAASEMHARVLAKLRAGMGQAPAESFRIRSWQLAKAAIERDREKGWNLLEYPARLSIRTIDSFCAHLVRSMPWLSAMGGIPAITENADELYQAAARATLQLVDDIPDVAAFVQHMDVDLNAAGNLLAAMLASRDQWLPLLGEGADADALVDNLQALIRTDLVALSAMMPPGWASSIGPLLSRAANVLASSSPSDPVLEPLLYWQGQPLGTDFEDIPAWQALASALLTSTGGLRKTVNARQGFPPKSKDKEEFLAWLAACSPDEPWVQALGRVRMLPAQGYTPEQHDTVRILLNVLRLSAAHLSMQFADQAQVDFIEIAQRAVQALGHEDAPSDLLLALDASVRHILVDEFQDTSDIQIGLLSRLTSGWLPDDGRTLFLVGDPMQSIYRFRKADVGGFLRVKAAGIGMVQLVSLELRDNFRSQANLVDWVNHTCGPVFPQASDPDLGAITYTPSVAFNNADPGGGVQFHPVWVRNDAPETEDDPSQNAENTVIELVRQALSAHAGSEHPVAVLVRARSHLDAIVQRLAAENIPCRAVELVTLRSRPVVVDLVQLAHALSHAGDRLAWLSVLRSPLCGLTLTSLHAIFGGDLARAVPDQLSCWLQRHAQGQGAITDTQARRLAHAASVLLDYGNHSGTLPFAAWLQLCWQRLGGPGIYASESDQADAEQVFRLIEKLAPFGALDPVELDERLDQLYAAPSSSGAAVEVMTIHKSKGLEFETVIVAGLHRTPRSDTTPLLMFERAGQRLVLGPIKSRATDKADPVSAYLASREALRASYEADRLLYVALTRARSRLHLVGQVRIDDNGQVKAPSPSSLLGRLWNYMAVPQQAPEPEATDSGNARVPAPGQSAAGRLVSPALQHIPDKPAALPGVSPGQPWHWRDQADDEALIGTVAHAWLERIGTDGTDAWPLQRLADAVPMMRRQLSRAGLPQEALDAGCQTLLATLQATLASQTGQWLLGVAQAYREWSLLDLDGRVSVIDLAISRENDWLVVDYKTGLPGPAESIDNFRQRMLARYGDQLTRYCTQVSALDGRAARAALYFPRADLWIEAPASDPNSC